MTGDASAHSTARLIASAVVVTVKPSPPSILTGSPLARRPFAFVTIAGLVLLFAAGIWVLLPRGASAAVWQVALTALGLALLAGLPAMALAVYLDRREPEPWWLLGLAFLWGAIASTGLAVVLNEVVGAEVNRLFDETAGLVDTTRLGFELLDQAQLFAWLQNSLVAPFVEEAVKGAALLLLLVLLPIEVNSVRDGIVYGGLVGLGFAVTEAVVYIVQDFVATGEPSYAAQLIPRFVLGGINGHALYSALLGAGLGLARQGDYGRVRKGLIGLGAFVLAVAAHSMSNAFGPFALAGFASLAGFDPNRVTIGQLWVLNLAKTMAVNVWVYVDLVYWTVRSGYWELGVCKDELAHEASDVVTPDEYTARRARGSVQTAATPRSLPPVVESPRARPERARLPSARCPPRRR